MKSMTGFSSGKGSGAGVAWAWDIRAVNARGLDMRLRVPDWISGLEQALRSFLQERVARGSVSVSLKVARDASEHMADVNPKALRSVLGQIAQIEETALGEHNLELAPSSATDILQMPGLRELTDQKTETDDLRQCLLADFQTVLEEFDTMRQTEGQALAQIITKQLDQIETLTGTAADQAAKRHDKTSETLRKNLSMVLENSEGADPDRVAQELALLAVKSDVTEEIDRLQAHVAAARGMVKTTGPIGRKLDFLTQEFNREANTLCSKAQSKDLTATGLDLKAVIDQMREQVQNVE